MAVVEVKSGKSGKSGRVLSTNVNLHEDDHLDITANLPTLRVESTFPEKKRNYLKLRSRSHMLISSVCAQLSFLVNAMNEARKLHSDMTSDSRAMARRHLSNNEETNPLQVGIIGCGHLGRTIIDCLLYGGCQSKNISISTRRPDALDDLKEKGISCFFNNNKVIQSCDFVILCVLPSQLPEVFDDIKDRIPAKCLLYSLVPAIPLVKMKQNLHHNQIIIPMYTWPKENEQCYWDYSLDVQEVFQEIGLLELTCPLTTRKHEAVVVTDHKWLELVLYAMVNFCVELEVNSLHAVQIINRVILGVIDTNPGLLLFEADDFSRKPIESDEIMPVFDLINVAKTETAFSKKLASESGSKIINAFREHYSQVFEQYNFKLKFDPFYQKP